MLYKKRCEELKSRLEIIARKVEHSYKLIEKYKNPTLKEYEEIKKSIKNFRKDEWIVEYDRLVPYDEFISMYDSLNEDFNRIGYKHIFKNFIRELSKKGINFNNIKDYSIKEYDEFLDKEDKTIASLYKLAYHCDKAKEYQAKLIKKIKELYDNNRNLQLGTTAFAQANNKIDYYNTEQGKLDFVDKVLSNEHNKKSKDDAQSSECVTEDTCENEFNME